MLVLSRQKNESITIGKDPETKIEITVVDIRGDKVRLGINAPTEIPVHRTEVYEAIQRENQRSTALPVDDNNKFEVEEVKRPEDRDGGRGLGINQPAPKTKP